MANGGAKRSSPTRRMPRRSLDDFLAKKNGILGMYVICFHHANTHTHTTVINHFNLQTYHFISLKDKGDDDCDISLCTATTKKDLRPTNQYTWKRNPQAIIPVKQKFGGFTPLSRNTGLMTMMQVKEENVSSLGKRSESSRFGLTLGIANLLYTQKSASEPNLSDQRSDWESMSRDGESGQRSDTESVTSETIFAGRRSVSCTFSVRTPDDTSIEVSMPPIEEGYELAFNETSLNENLYERVRLAEERCMAEEARLEDHTRLAQEKQLADEERLAEMTRETKAVHLEKNKRLSKLAEEAKTAEKARNAEEFKLSGLLQNVLAKLEEEKRIFKNIRLEEEKYLVEEEERLVEKRRSLEEAYQLEEARMAQQTRRAEARLFEQARLAEERHQVEQSRLAVITRQVEEARAKAEEARYLVEEARLVDSLTFDDTFSMGGGILQALSEEKTWDLERNPSEILVEEDEFLSREHWKELDASLFEVRGKNYLVDRKKISSAPNLLRLITVDLIQVEDPIMTGFCSHPKGRVSKKRSWIMLHLYHDLTFKLCKIGATDASTRETKRC